MKWNMELQYQYHTFSHDHQIGDHISLLEYLHRPSLSLATPHLLQTCSESKKCNVAFLYFNNSFLSFGEKSYKENIWSVFTGKTLIIVKTTIMKYIPEQNKNCLRKGLEIIVSMYLCSWVQRNFTKHLERKWILNELKMIFGKLHRIKKKIWKMNKHNG